MFFIEFRRSSNRSSHFTNIHLPFIYTIITFVRVGLNNDKYFYHNIFKNNINNNNIIIRTITIILSTKRIQR
jgi:hypothetical protein